MRTLETLVIENAYCVAPAVGIVQLLPCQNLILSPGCINCVYPFICILHSMCNLPDLAVSVYHHSLVRTVQTLIRTWDLLRS